MRAHGRGDGNHADVVEAMRAAGASVLDLKAVGAGCPDVLVGVSGIDQIVEIKDGRQPPSKRQLRQSQRSFADVWRGRPVVVVESVADALDLIRALRAEAWRRAE